MSSRSYSASLTKSRYRLMSSRSTSTPPPAAARKKRSNLVKRAHHGHRRYLLSGARSFESKPDRHRALAYGRGDSFGRAGAHVADREDAGLAGLQQRALGSVRTWPGADESVVIEIDQPAEPAGARGHADEDEQRPGVDGAPRAGPVVGDGNGLQRRLAVQFPDLCAGHDMYVRNPRDPVDEVAGHVLAQVAFADDERDLGSVRG